MRSLAQNICCQTEAIDHELMLVNVSIILRFYENMAHWLHFIMTTVDASVGFHE